MKKQIASGLIGLLALGGAAGLAAPVAFAQDDEAPEAQAPTQEQIDDKLDFLAQAVESGRITQAQADEIAERIESGEFTGRSGRMGRMGDRGDKMASLSEAIGLDADEIRAGYEAGQSLAETAEANGVDVDAMIDALVEQMNERIDEKVADGTIDEERAAELRGEMEERITERVNTAPGEFERSGRFGRSFGQNGEVEPASA